MIDPVLYQLNVARMLAPHGDPRMEGFRVWTDALHSLAERSRGFVRRLRGERLGPGYVVVDPADPLLMGNLSAWESIDDLAAFAFSGAHAHLLRRRLEWFEPHDPGEPHHVLWWQSRAADPPAVAGAMARLDLLRRRGDSPEAFGLGRARREVRP